MDPIRKMFVTSQGHRAYSLMNVKKHFSRKTPHLPRISRTQKPLDDAQPARWFMGQSLDLERGRRAFAVFGGKVLEADRSADRSRLVPRLGNK